MRIFISYCRESHAQFADRVYRLLQEQKALTEVYVDSRDSGLGSWQERVQIKLQKTDLFLLLVSGELGNGQNGEATMFSSICKNTKRSLADHAFVGKIVTDQAVHPLIPVNYQECRIEEIHGFGYSDAVAFVTTVLKAKGIAAKFGGAFAANKWQSYEKYIIDASLKTPDSPDYLCWPDVENRFGAAVGYPQFLKKQVIGGVRPDSARILVDARNQYHTLGCNPADPHSRCLMREHLSFAEAGPRGTLRYPLNWKGNLGIMNIGIVVTGGIAPGINAVISGIVQRHLLYHSPSADQVEVNKEAPSYQLNILGYMNGFVPGASHTLLFASHGPNQTSLPAARADARRSADEPGSRLGTSRQEKMLGSSDPDERAEAISRIVTRLIEDGIHILYVIGGDGSMRAAHAIWEASQRNRNPISVVAVPKTMDNDILWVWQSFGFLSAVEKAREALQQLHVEVRSNPRLCICQLFGSDSGFVVSHAALASGVCDLALIPEVPFSMEVVGAYIVQKLSERFLEDRSPYALVAMAETAIPTDVEKYIDDPFIGLDAEEQKHVRLFLSHDRRVEGQTPDELRRAGLKIVSKVLERRIHNVEAFAGFRVFTNEPRHLLRTTGPSVSDVIFGQRLGTLAVDNAMAGYTDFMISQWMTEYVLVPLPLVILGRKRMPPDGIFWMSVLSGTGQPASLDK